MNSRETSPRFTAVMADSPAIHAFFAKWPPKGVDARRKQGMTLKLSAFE